MRAVGAAASSMFATFATGAAIGAVGSLAALTARSIEAADEMGKLAQKAGLPVEQFSQLAFAAKQADVSSETLVKGLKELSLEMVAQGRGSEDLLQHFLAQADAIGKLGTGAEKTAAAQAIFKKSALELIPLLNDGSDAIRKQMQEADRLGQTISTQFAKDADEFDDNIGKAKAGLTALGNTIAQAALPRLLELQTYFLDTGTNAGKARTLVDDLTTSLLFMSNLGEQLKAAKWWQWLIPVGGLGNAIPNAWEKTIQQMADAMQNVPDEEKPGFPSVSVSPIIGGVSIEDIGKWEQAHSDAIMRARELEDQFALMKLTGSEQERARIDADYQHWLTKIAQMRLDEDQSIALSNQAWEGYHKHLRDLQLETYADNLRIAARGFAAAASLSAAFGKKNFELTKGLRMGETVMNTAAGIIQAWIHPGWPGAIALTAVIAAEGAAQLATIAAQKPPAAHYGLDYVPVESPYLLQRGERVVNPGDNPKLTRMLEDYDRGEFGGGQTTVNLILDGNVLSTWVYQSTRNGQTTVHPRSLREYV